MKTPEDITMVGTEYKYLQDYADGILTVRSLDEGAGPFVELEIEGKISLSPEELPWLIGIIEKAIEPMPTKEPQRPAYICTVCGKRYGTNSNTISTFHEGECGWCGVSGIPVTEPRDYGAVKWPIEK